MEGWGGDDWPTGKESSSDAECGTASGGLTRTEIHIPDGAVTLFVAGSGGSGRAGSKTTHQMAQPGGAGHILEEGMSDVGKATSASPLAARGGVLAPADKNILKTVLMFYINERGDQLDGTEAMQLINLLHRVNRLR